MFGYDVRCVFANCQIKFHFRGSGQAQVPFIMLITGPNRRRWIRMAQKLGSNNKLEFDLMER